MKIKEVCKRTGLTERTVRFYAEEQLFSPKSSFKNGRNYSDYSEQDIVELITIADLRKLFFTINEIKEMKDSPTKITEIVTAYKHKLTADVTAKASIIQTLDQINLSSFPDLDSLALSLKSVAVNLQLPKRDISPNFGRFERDTKENRESEYQLFKDRQERQYSIGKVIVFSIASLHIIFAIISVFIDFNFLSLLIQVALAIALFAGVTWVRYLFVFGAALSIFISFLLLTGGYVSEMPWVLIWLIVIQMIYAAVASVLLLTNNAIKEFLYAQKHG